MDNFSFKWVVLCLLLFVGGSASGWAIAYKMAGPNASTSFLHAAAIIVAISFMLQLALFYVYKRTLIGQILFRVIAGLAVTWFMLCLVLPIFWMPSIGLVGKSALATLSALLFVSNGMVGLRHFEQRWVEKALPIEKFCNLATAAIDWQKITKSLHITVSIYLPGMPRWLDPIFSVLAVLSMILGLNLRNPYPVFSIFAWGIPCIYAAAGIVQMTAINIAQLIKVYELEKRMCIRFASGGPARTSRA